MYIELKDGIRFLLAIEPNKNDNMYYIYLQDLEEELDIKECTKVANICLEDIANIYEELLATIEDKNRDKLKTTLKVIK